MSNYKLSIITINYNNLPGLKCTLASIFNQKVRDFEYIIIDGGSTDGSKELIEKYNDHISYWTSEQDNGIYHAMNKGIGIARGEFLYFLNSGDLLSDSFNDCLNYLDFFHSLFCYRYFIEENGIKYKSETNKKDFISLFDDMINHQSIIYSKDCFENDKFDDSYKYCADYKHLLSCLLKGKKIKNIDECLAVYNMFGVSSNDENKVDLINERKIIQKEIMNENLFDLWDKAFYFKQELYQIKRSRIFKFFKFLLLR
jgi:glycosyltransferase involved in cell wall biosynthesis